jgi:hypothetical protein
MTDAGLMRKASIDWDHLDTTDSTGGRPGRETTARSVNSRSGRREIWQAEGGAPGNVPVVDGRFANSTPPGPPFAGVQGR